MQSKIYSVLLGLILIVGLSSFDRCSHPLGLTNNKILAGTNYDVLKEGDIVFQQSVSPKCAAIKAATGSAWTHVGIVVRKNNQWMVLEAVEPVKMTPIADWLARSKVNEVRRLKATEKGWDEASLKDMHTMGEKWLKKHYDIGFAWSDDEMYCSELVYKLYDRILNIKVGAMKQLKDYDLSSPIVKRIMKERYGDQIPYDEWMIAPGVMYDSPLLEEVKIPNS
jgi:hypothetical protein